MDAGSLGHFCELPATPTLLALCWEIPSVALHVTDCTQQRRDVLTEHVVTLFFQFYC